jgi:hypothetical protein
MKFKNAADLKYYLYVSEVKLDMLYSQVASSAKEKKSVEWGLDLKALKGTRKFESEDQPDRDDKLKAVIQALEHSQIVGTVDEPKEYVKGTLPMRWGIYRDAGRPTEEPPLVYFGGRTEQTVFGFGGSSRHVEGNAGCAATGSRSVTPFLVTHLLEGMQTEGWNAHRTRGTNDEESTCEAIVLATDNIRPPDQNLEFFSKTLLQCRFPDSKSGRKGIIRVLLGGPLFVALASPSPDDISNY